MRPVAPGHQARRTGPGVRPERPVAPLCAGIAPRMLTFVPGAYAAAARPAAPRVPSGSTPQETPHDAPRRHVARRPARPPRGHRPPRRRPPRHRRRGRASATPGSATWPGRPRSRTDEADDRGRAVARLGGEPGARRPRRRASRSCTRPAPAARSPASRSRRSTSGPRRSTWPGPSTRRPRRPTSARSSSSSPGASRPTRSSARSTTRRRSSPARSRPAGAGPVFIQGDHYQFNAKKYAADPEAMTEEIRRACRLAIDAGYRNIDIDSSTLVDLSKPNVDEEQRENYARAAELTALIRSLETDGVTVSVGGEIGEVGTQNSTVGGAAGLPRRLSARARRRGARAPRASPRSASRPARATAACRCPTAAWPRSSSTSRSCASSARSPASTAWPARSSTARRRCPTSCSTASRRSRPPRSTSRPGFQNALYEHPAFPGRAPRTRSRPGASRTRADERKAGQTDQQFVYTTRKKAIGPFKRQLWDLATKDEILAAQAAKIAFLFTELRVERVDGARRALHHARRRSRGRSPRPSRPRSADRASPRSASRPPVSDDSTRRLRRPAG